MATLVKPDRTTFDVHYLNGGCVRVTGVLFGWRGSITVTTDPDTIEGFTYSATGYGHVPSAAWLTAVAAWRDHQLDMQVPS